MICNSPTMSYSSEAHIQNNRKSDKDNRHDPCQTDQIALLRTALVLTPVRIRGRCHTGDRAKTSVLALLHEYDNDQRYGIYCKQNCQYSAKNNQNKPSCF